MKFYESHCNQEDAGHLWDNLAICSPRIWSENTPIQLNIHERNYQNYISPFPSLDLRKNEKMKNYFYTIIFYKNENVFFVRVCYDIFGIEGF